MDAGVKTEHATGHATVGGQPDFGIGPLIILLLVFWYMCKHSGGSCGNSCGKSCAASKCGGSNHAQHNSHSECMNGSESYPGRAIPDKQVSVVRSRYGNTPIRIGSAAGVKYIRTVDTGNKQSPREVEIPNSKTAMRRLYDDVVPRGNSVNRQEAMSQSFANMHMGKQYLQNVRSNPTSMTSSRFMVQSSQ